VHEAVEPVDRMTGRELLAALDAALSSLPPRYREPLVLCYLEGLTHKEAATRLGVPLGTLHTCVDRARKRLHEVLTKAGCTMGAGLLTLLVSSPAGASSPRLVKSILSTVSGSVPAAVGELAKGVAMNGVFKKTVMAIVTVIGITAMNIGLGSAGSSAVGWPQATTTTVAANPSQAATEPVDAKRTTTGLEKDEKPKESPVSGRVLGVDGKPFAGAELLLVGKGDKPKKLGISGPDGRFTVTAPRGEKWANLIARADEFGIDFVDLGRIPLTAEVELQLAKDNAIRGRIVDTQGKPVADATVQIRSVNIHGNNLDPFLTEWKIRNPHYGLPNGTKRIADDSLFPPAMTDKNGRFAIAGTGSERLVELRVSGAAIAAEEMWVVNRPEFDPKPYNQATEDKLTMPFAVGPRWMLYGPEPAMFVETEKPIRGVVKDKDTGKPRAGVKVTLSRYGDDIASIMLSATTDSEGRYEIHGARKSKAYMVEVASDTASGHMAAQGRADDVAGYEPITIDLTVKRGVIVTGRVIDKGTGKPIPGFVMTNALNANPYVKEYPEYESSVWMKGESTGPDGTFRTVAFPGAVVLMGGPEISRLPEGMLGWYRYKPIAADPKYPNFFAMNSGLGSAYFGVDGVIRPLQGTACKVLEIKAGTATVEQDLIVEPATELLVKIRDAEGKPVNGVWATGIGSYDWHRPVEVKGDTTSAYHLEGKPRLMVFYEPSRKLFGTLNLKGDEKDAVTVTLGTGGSVKGQVIGADGKPVAGVAISLHHRVRPVDEIHDYVHRARLVETDVEGKFRIDDIVPGIKFELSFSRGKQQFELTTTANLTAEPGKAIDAGELKLKSKAQRGE
ncbi:MAG TPA: sigma factor-like helix-turn-helix DNA-binding protein, partial [Gemmata sp.]|nr:sigma factor-like helix-turn-helix DNA-binding protein [Gemmata sp.]